MHNELPRLQGSYHLTLLEEHNARVCFINKVINILEIRKDDIRIVVDLGSGRGVGTDALLNCFPKAVVHAIDYYDILAPKIKTNPRVKFHKGRLVDVLKKGGVPTADLTYLSFISHTHGFSKENIQLLADLVGKGFLVMVGDNGMLERQPWFWNKFEQIFGYDPDIYDTSIYKCRERDTSEV